MSENFDGDYPVEHVAYEGIPLPVKRTRIKNPGSRPDRVKKKIGGRDYSRQPSREHEKFEGRYDYTCLRHGQILVPFLNKPGFASNSKAGIPNGMNKEMATQAWAEAKILARRDMDVIKAAFPTTDEIVEEATMVLLTNLRGPTDDTIKLSSAKTLLDFYKEKPKSKRDVTVNTFETWLGSISDQSE